MVPNLFLGAGNGAGVISDGVALAAMAGEMEEGSCISIPIGIGDFGGCGGEYGRRRWQSPKWGKGGAETFTREAPSEYI